MIASSQFIAEFLARLASMGTDVVVVLLIGLLILIHELGHFFAARWTGMRIEELSIGVGRKVWGTVKDGVEYSLRLIPFLGYVKITGMGLLDEEEPDGFNSRPWIARVMTLAAGGVTNIVFAALMFAGIVFTYGVVVDSTSAIDRVLRGKPAEGAGFQTGDRIVGIAGRRTIEVDTIREEIEKRPGKPVVIDVERNGKRVALEVTPAATKSFVQEEDGTIRQVQIGLIGIGFHPVRRRLGALESLQSGFLRVSYESVSILYAVWLALKGYPVLQLIGPVGIVNELGGEAREGKKAIPDVLDKLARISVTLGLLNLVIPFPGLDGGRLWFLFLTPVVEFIRRRKVSRKIEVWAHTAGVGILIVLLAFITIRDVVNWH